MDTDTETVCVNRHLRSVYTDRLRLRQIYIEGRNGFQTILSFKRSVNAGTMIKLNGDGSVKACLHVPSTSPCPSPSKFNTVPMEADRLVERLGSEQFTQ